jgi:membrane protein implicated in regulation of membrane protease activity
MRDVGRLLIIAGVVLLVAGLLFTAFPRLGLGRLPGDIVYRKGNFTFYFPLMTSIILSIVLTMIFWLFRR